jgi:DNA/RNA endonuclease G (NUC1)
VPVLKFDEAGHITFAETHTVTVPENFNKVVVTVTGKDSVVINGASAAATIEADSLTDTLTFDVGNRWIQIAGNAGNDKITLYHAAPGD